MFTFGKTKSANLRMISGTAIQLAFSRVWILKFSFFFVVQLNWRLARARTLAEMDSSEAEFEILCFPQIRFGILKKKVNYAASDGHNKTDNFRG